MSKFEYVISACLCGVPCRYDGKIKADGECVKLYEDGKAVLVCPEVMGGLTTPRTACEIVGDKVVSKTGEDKTKQYKNGAVAVLALCKLHGIKKAILKEKSPSCGCEFVYDGTFTGNLIKGKGVTAALLIQNGIDTVAK